MNRETLRQATFSIAIATFLLGFGTSESADARPNAKKAVAVNQSFDAGFTWAYIMQGHNNPPACAQAGYPTFQSPDTLLKNSICSVKSSNEKVGKLIIECGHGGHARGSRSNNGSLVGTHLFFKTEAACKDPKLHSMIK